MDPNDADSVAEERTVVETEVGTNLGVRPTVEADDDDDDSEVSFSFAYEEVPGKRKNSVLYQTTDDHLWRNNKKLSETKKYLYCYHFITTVDSRVTKKCHATAILDLNSRRIVPKKPHNHDPDHELLNLLKLREKVLSKAESSNVRLNQVFDDATRGQEGACRLGFYTMSRWVTDKFSLVKIESVIHS